MKRILCWIFGHPDSVIEWGKWLSDEELGRYRIVTERCTRCDGVLGVSSITAWDLMWRAS